MKLINYSGNEKKTGVYSIRNNVNNKLYIGSTKCSFESRKNRHQRNLRNNTHYNEFLQNSWNKYGEEKFSFEILYLCSPEKCILNEGKMIELYSSNEREFGYNIASVQEYKFKYKFSETHNNEKSIRKLEKSKKINGFSTSEKGICKPFKIYDLQGNFIKEYKSAVEYCFENKIQIRGMLSTILNKRKLIYKNNIILYSNDIITIDDLLQVEIKINKRKLKKVVLLDLNNNYIRNFDSAKECSEYIGCKIAEIRMCCLKKRNRIKKYITRYENE